MEIKLKGEMTLADIRQALFEQLCTLERAEAVRLNQWRSEKWRERMLAAIASEMADLCGHGRRTHAGRFETAYKRRNHSGCHTNR
jgi:hypothetical protein